MNYKEYRQNTPWPNPASAGGTEEHHEKPQTGHQVSSPKFQLMTSSI